MSISAPDVDLPLRHHGDSDLGPGLVDLAVNVRMGAPPPWLRSVLAGALDTVAAYPDPRRARASVAARHGREPDEVLLTAGAAEAFVLLARVLRPVHPTVVHPQFTEPEAALLAAGHAVERVTLTARDGFRVDPAAIPDRADLVVIGNPTNPTSVLHPADQLARLARPGRLLVVDEAFADAVPGDPESLAGRTDLPGVVVIRSLTKVWGLAGLRAGYLIAAADLVAELVRAQPLWPVSTPALAALAACSSPAAVAEAGRAALTTEVHRDLLLAHLARLAEVADLRVTQPARASFVLVRVPNGDRIRRRLRDRGFAVRRGDTFPGLGPDYLRVTVREPATTSAFVTALGESLRAS